MSDQSNSLSEVVQPDLQKLKRRLASEGLSSVEAMGYERYLRSTLWKTIRGWVLERDKKTCQVCLHKSWNPTKDGMDVHHRDYELDTLEGKNSSALIALCRKCHERVEYFPNGNKRTSLPEKDAELERLQELHRAIVTEGMPLAMEIKTTSKRVRVILDYVGPAEFLEFYSLGSLATGVVLDFFVKFREELRLPLPFARHKLKQRSGANVISRKTNKKVLNAKLDEGRAIFSQPTDTGYDIYHHIMDYVSENQSWKIDHGGAQQISAGDI